MSNAKLQLLIEKNADFIIPTADRHKAEVFFKLLTQYGFAYIYDDNTRLVWVRQKDGNRPPIAQRWYINGLFDGFFKTEV